ncbi:aminopeptidase C [Enterococcus sulfureus]|uniref:aminopeptidase C n=1 Tax=Enterococcus TaxID=1350 RepID=UPI001FE0BE42|nr:C1 family peptidase [Enterococcus sulfureus]
MIKVKGLTKELIQEIQHSTENKSYRVAQHAVTTNGIFKAAQNIQAINENYFNFSVDIDDHLVTNQNHSGRCWMFACLNILRSHIETQYEIENFELSQNYLYFWDKLEKANYFYQQILATANKKLASRTVQYLLTTPQQDGGDWNLVLSLVEKYGLVPHYAMNETSCSIDSTELNTILNRKLRKDAYAIREMVDHHAKHCEVEMYIKHQLKIIYTILCTSLGTPPETFDFTFRTKTNTFEQYPNLTPLQFYQEYLTLDLTDYVAIINVPDESMPFHQLYQVQLSDNMIDGIPNYYVNVPIEQMKEFTIAQLKASEPVFFGCDVLKYFDRTKGIMSYDLYDFDALFDTTFTMPKGPRFVYRESLPTHAMVIGGVHIVNEQPIRWKVENSWGREIGDKGFFVMDDAWMSEFVYEVVIKKEFLSKDVLSVLEQEPTVLPFWNPMNPIAAQK